MVCQHKLWLNIGLWSEKVHAFLRLENLFGSCAQSPYFCSFISTSSSQWENESCANAVKFLEKARPKVRFVLSTKNGIGHHLKIGPSPWKLRMLLRHRALLQCRPSLTASGSAVTLSSSPRPGSSNSVAAWRSRSYLVQLSTEGSMDELVTKDQSAISILLTKHLKVELENSRIVRRWRRWWTMTKDKKKKGKKKKKIKEIYEF